MKQKLLLLGAVVFGFLAFILSYNQLQAEKKRIIGTGETVILIKVKRDLIEGEEIRENDITSAEEKRMPNTIMREIPWSDRHNVIGRRVDTRLAAGTYLQRTDLKALSRHQGFSGTIEGRMRAISIPVDSVGSVSGLVQPNDNVDVIGTFRFPDMRGDQALDTVTLTLLQNVKVLAVGPRWGDAGIDVTSSRGYSSVTLVVYPEEVEMLIFASQKGKLSLSLRRFDDAIIERSVESRSVNFRELEQSIPKYNDRRSKSRF